MQNTAAVVFLVLLFDRVGMSGQQKLIIMPWVGWRWGAGWLDCRGKHGTKNSPLALDCQYVFIHVHARRSSYERFATFFTIDIYVRPKQLESKHVSYVRKALNTLEKCVIHCLSGKHFESFVTNAQREQATKVATG